MPGNNPDNLEPIDPSTAQQLYLDFKSSQASEITVQSHRYRTNHFVRWCDEQGIDNLNDLTGRHIHQYRLWRKEDGELNAVSMQTQMSTLRVFLEWAATIEAVDPNLYTKVMISKVPEEDQQRDEMLSAERAEEVLTHLSDYYYASLKHVLIALLWETGVRVRPLFKNSTSEESVMSSWSSSKSIFPPPLKNSIQFNLNLAVHLRHKLLVPGIQMLPYDRKAVPRPQRSRRADKGLAR